MFIYCKDEHLYKGADILNLTIFVKMYIANLVMLYYSTVIIMSKKSWLFFHIKCNSFKVNIHEIQMTLRKVTSA